MKPFSNHRTPRRTTFLALIVWLFALASGMANACRLEAPGGHAHASAAHHKSDAGYVHAEDMLVHHFVAVDARDDDTDNPMETCLKACDDGANALVKMLPGVDPMQTLGKHSVTVN